jgi:7 transmembrane sweet-taste receptor of 3 GCPR
MWAFTGPLIAIHVLLMITTNAILYQVRGVADRYQEQKYVALASAFVCEVLVIGLPVLLSVGDNPIAVFIVLSGLIAMNDVGMLCFVFIPKIKFQKKKITEGINVGETILKETHKKASIRESIRRAPSSMFSTNLSRADSMPFSSESRSDRQSSLKFHSNIMAESIIEANEEDDEEPDFERNTNQGQRRSFATPRTDTGTEDAEGIDFSDSDSDSKPHVALNLELEREKVKNCGLMHELSELREIERSLKARVGELERLLESKGSEDPQFMDECEEEP